MQSLAFAPVKCQKAQTVETVIAASPDLAECSILHDPTLICERPTSFPASLSEKNDDRRAGVFPKHKLHSV